jgi:hypothetical protein
MRRFLFVEAPIPVTIQPLLEAYLSALAPLQAHVSSQERGHRLAMEVSEKLIVSVTQARSAIQVRHLNKMVFLTGLLQTGNL